MPSKITFILRGQSYRDYAKTFSIKIISLYFKTSIYGWS